MSEIPKEVLAAKLEEQRLADAAGARAAAMALPGPLVDIFAPKPNIKVGKYEVRPFYDRDFETLQRLDHPFASFAVGNTKELESFIPRGPNAWNLFYLLTKPVLEAEAQLKTDGVDSFAERAKEEFGQYQLGANMVLFKAVVKQLTVYASAVVGYEPATVDEDGKEASSNRPPSLPA